MPDHLALLWFSQYAPSSSSYAPFYVSAEYVPTPYARCFCSIACLSLETNARVLTRGFLYKYDSSVSFWNFLAVGNYACEPLPFSTSLALKAPTSPRAARFYKYAMRDVQALQSSLMESHLAAKASLEGHVLSLLAADPYSPESNGAVVNLLTAFTNQQANAVVTAWKSLLPHLITKYHDGYIATKLDTSSLQMKKMFYPKWWLDLTGFWKNAAVKGPDVIMFQPAPPVTTTPSSSPYFSVGAMINAVVVTAVATCALTALAGAYFLRSKERNSRLSSLGSRRHDYIAIHNL